MGGYDINWSSLGGNPLLRHPLYQKYYLKSVGSIDKAEVQQDLAGCIPSRDGAAIMAYLSWLIRVSTLLEA